METLITVLDKRGENAVESVVKVLKALGTERSGDCGLATSTGYSVAEDLCALQSQNVKSAAAIGYTLPPNKTQSATLTNAALVFTGRIYSPTHAGATAEFVASRLKHNRYEGAEALLAEAEGEYAFIIAEAERIVAGRDPIGVQPLYYGENSEVAALAVNRRALWKLGIEETRSFPPGHLALVSREGFRFKAAKTFVYAKPQPVTIKEAAETLQKLLENSVRERVLGLREVAVAFSGGLDSSVVAFLAKKCGVSVNLIHVSLRGQPETATARKAADELKLPLQVYLFAEEDVEEVVARVVGLIEEPDAVKASIGVPFYLVAEKTAQAGCRALLAGQGADELFGGYQRYVNDYLAGGEEKVKRVIFDDVVGIHESNIERDAKICGFHDVELRLPFASCALVGFALSLPLELKIEKSRDSLRKLVLRKAAENMGLPASITAKPKKAIQYSTGINAVLKKTAKRHCLTVNEYVNRLFRESV